ncbi:hypothetical protein GCM10022377_18580 [Zhihengliuella alba]|uniref:Uncharacterized protein n=1 Tax=Zhihengliuella alba TaxID=547018 RepID=A0ABP7DJP9_9MICC
MKKFDRRPLALVAATLLLGLAACGPGDGGQNGTGDDSAATAPTAAGTEGTTDAPAPGSESGSDADGADRRIDVEAIGDGPIGLTTAEAAQNGDDASGRLITGPGGCFAVVDNAEPQLLLFPEDAEFVLRDGQPSVTTSGLGTVEVGKQFDFSAEAVALEDTAGIPDRCTHGEATEVLLLAE